MTSASGFTRTFSLEATRPTAAEIAEIAGFVPRGTSVYFSAVPTITPGEIVAAAALLRKSGLEPVIHIAARRTHSAADLRDLLRSLRGEADARRLLIIGGDIEAAGAFPDALSLIQKAGLSEAGFEEIGIAAYPEGHPRIPADRLEAALDAKLATIAAQGLRAHIVSQFSFSPERILAWLTRLRACGISVPVKVGMAGPTSVMSLLRYAQRCGVSASLRGLASGMAAGLANNVGPDRIVAELATARDLGDVSPHYFSFGGLATTARYACTAAGLVPGARAIAH